MHDLRSAPLLRIPRRAWEREQREQLSRCVLVPTLCVGMHASTRRIYKMKKFLIAQTGVAVTPIGLGTVKLGRNQGVKYPTTFEIPECDSFGLIR